MSVSHGPDPAVFARRAGSDTYLVCLWGYRKRWARACVYVHRPRYPTMPLLCPQRINVESSPREVTSRAILGMQCTCVTTRHMWPSPRVAHELSFWFDACLCGLVWCCLVLSSLVAKQSPTGFQFV